MFRVLTDILTGVKTTFSAVLCRKTGSKLYTIFAGHLTEINYQKIGQNADSDTVWWGLISQVLTAYEQEIRDTLNAYISDN